MAKKGPGRGRVGLFGRKGGGLWVSGALTKEGKAAFQRRRKELEALHEDTRGRRPSTVTKADVVEFALRGAEDSREYLSRDSG